MENALLPQLWCLVLSVIHRNLASEEWRLWKESNIGASRWGRRGSGYEELCEWREGLLIESIVGQEASEASGGQEWWSWEWEGRCAASSGCTGVYLGFWMMCDRECYCSSWFCMWWRHGSKFRQQRRKVMCRGELCFFRWKKAVLVIWVTWCSKEKLLSKWLRGCECCEWKVQ